MTPGAFELILRTDPGATERWRGRSADEDVGGRLEEAFHDGPRISDKPRQLDCADYLCASKGDADYLRRSNAPHTRWRHRHAETYSN
jgi:hypothetical protein